MTELPLPDGFEFDDRVTGRTWTVAGSEMVLGWPPSPREVLRDAWLAVLGPDRVLASPPELVAPPAAVIRPADPYQAPYTSSGAVGSAWAFDVDIIVSRNLVDQGLGQLERAREFLCDNLPPGWRWLEFGGIGEITVAEKTYLKGTLGLAVASPGGLDDFELKE